MKKRVVYAVPGGGLTMLAALSVLLMLGSAVIRIVWAAGEQGMSSGFFWMQIVLPVAACVLFILMGTAAALVAGLVVLRRVLFTSNPRFLLREVSVQSEGYWRDRSPALASRLGIHLGDNLFSIDPGELRRRLAAIPNVEHCEVTRILPDTLHLKLLEPLRGLFKDEVRELGVALGLPAEMVYRHPFPGPGLGVRILGEVKKEYADLLREADAIFIEELRKAGLYDKVSQAFVVFLPVKSVGVMGDGRTYEWVVSLRSVETSDFMTARWSHLPYELLGTVSNRIINEVRGINRVCYDISGKPPATIEWE